MNEVPIIQSVLFKSPYSGCGKFSGWPKAPCIQAPGSVWPAQNRLQPLYCVDRYSKTYKAMPRVAQVAIVHRTTAYKPTQAGRFTVKGPSSAGPYSVATAEGIIWMGDEQWDVATPRPGTENHGWS
jgi:hypothetical protein